MRTCEHAHLSAVVTSALMAAGLPHTAGDVAALSAQLVPGLQVTASEPAAPLRSLPLALNGDQPVGKVGITVASASSSSSANGSSPPELLIVPALSTSVLSFHQANPMRSPHAKTLAVS